MLIIVIGTGTVRLMFRNGAAPKLFGSRYVYYLQEDMGSRVPYGSLVFAEDTDQIDEQDIVLFKNEDDEYRIGIASLIVDTDAASSEQSGKTYYLTTVTNITAFETDESRIVGICLRRSAELGTLIGFLTSAVGLIIGIIFPIALVAIYLVMAFTRRNDHFDASEFTANDLEFVKSIQQKQQKLAERDAKRAEKERQKTMTFDTDFYEEEPEEYQKPPRRLSEEEEARLEEEEAARRAERIAAVRSHMEQRRQTETPDGVPLYTTEIITKTHTLSIPRTGDKPLTTTQQRSLKPTPTAEIPRLTATGHIQIPTAEQLAEEKAREERLRKAQELARAAQDEALDYSSYRGSHAYSDDEPRPSKEKESKSKYETKSETKVLPVEEPTPAPVQPEPVAEPEPAAETEPAPVAEPETVSEPAAEPVKEAAEQEQKPKHKKSKSAKKQKIASSNFNDLMAFLDNEQKKL